MLSSRRRPRTASYTARALISRLAVAGLTLSLLACGSRRGPRRYTPAQVAADNAPERDFWQMPALIVEKMGLRPGMRVLDLGAGAGYMLPWLSRAVGPRGIVWAAEVQPDLVALLERRVAREGLRNVRVLLSTNDAVHLPEPIDRVLLLNTYRELSDPIAMLRSVRLALRPGGRLAIIDHLPFADVPGPPLDERLSLDTVIAEARGAGFVDSQQFKILPRQYFALFVNHEELDASAPEEAPATAPAAGPQAPANAPGAP